MIKKTFKELNKFTNTFGELIKKSEKNKTDFLNTKLGYACKRFEEVSLAPLYKEYNKEMMNVRVDNALTDPKTGALLTTPENQGRGFQYDKTGFKAVIAAEEEIVNRWDKKEFDIEPYICKPENIPADLTEDEMESLKDFVI